MMERLVFVLAAFPGAVALAMALPVMAQPRSAGPAAASEPGLHAWTCRLPTVNVDSTLADARPGTKFFGYGAQAMREGDYLHAVYMFKVAASWADEPAEYDLGLIYFRGEGVPVDRPLGAAWMVLAAQRGNPFYVHARDLLVTALTDAQFQRMNALWDELRTTYGDKVALRRAEAQWATVRSNDVVGSHLGAVTGPIRVATLGPTGLHWVAGKGAVEEQRDATLWQTNNPYDYVAKGQVSSCPAGTVTIEPLEQIRKPAKATGKTMKSGSNP